MAAKNAYITPIDARNMAVSVLNALAATPGLTLDHAIDAHEPQLSALSKRDRAFFNALLFGVLRFRNHLDHLIRFVITIPFHKIDPAIANFLRIGVFQLRFMDRVPPSAAVNTTVDLVKKARFPLWIVKFTNGVLRNAARKMAETPFPDPATEPERYLSIHHSFPEWLVKRWVSRFGLSTTEALCRSLNQIPPTTLRVNTLKIDRNRFLERLSQEGIDAAPTLYSPDGVLIRGGYDGVGHLPGYPEGLFQVQDEAAQLVTSLLDPRPGETLLDACAGLGGKTLHMAQRMKDQGVIVAVDRDRTRLQKLIQEKNRLGIESVQAALMDMESPGLISSGGRFDRVLVDAPCSGLGVIRRNPDIKWQPHKADLTLFKKRQLRLLQGAMVFVKSGGVMVYAVCSTEPEENKAVVDDFLNENPSFEIDTPLGEGIAPLASLMDKEGYLTTLPSPSLMDGFFAVRLRRRGASIR